MKNLKVTVFIFSILCFGSSMNAQNTVIEGKLGIGTDTPDQQLTVSSADSATIRLERSGAGRWDVELVNVGGSIEVRGGGDKTGTELTSHLVFAPYFRDASAIEDGMILIGHNSGENLAIDNNEILARNNGSLSTLFLQRDGGNIVMSDVAGAVSIGTTKIASGYLLNVDGKVACEEVLVELDGDWPDYVFQSSYQLPSLTEVKSHIDTQGHLIGVPSAQEIEDSGISLGNMNKILLEKIEELTLYILDQDDKIKKLEKGLSDYASLLERLNNLEQSVKK